MTVIDLHILQAFPPSLLNRDDMGQPKTIIFGGTTRTRVSSQSLKRAQRLYTATHGLLPAESLAIRTRHLPSMLAQRLVEGHRVAPEDSLKLALNTVWGMGLLDAARDVKRTSVLLFLGLGEIHNIAALVASRQRELLECAVPADQIGASTDTEAARQASTRQRKAACPAAFRELGKHALGSTDPTSIVDVALYGRFLAEDHRFDVDGSASTAHAFSVGEHHLELDYYTAVDDMDERGAGFLDTASLTAPLLYRYSNVDTSALLTNLSGNEELAAAATSAWLTAAVHALPRAKKTSTAPSTRPLLVFAAVRDDQPVSMANAFLRPVRATRQTDEGQASVNALARHWRQHGDAYGHDGVLATYLTYVGDAADIPPELSGEAVSAAELIKRAAARALARESVLA